MSIILRIKELADNEDIKITNLEKKISASKGVLSRALNKNTDIQSKWISRIVENYPLYNPIWLLTGEGNMLLNTINKSSPSSKPSNLKGIPLVDAYAIGGFGGSDFSIQAHDVKANYVIPKFENKKVDFMIEVNGSSMYPKYNSGDVVACRIIRDSKIIQWNKTYVVATEENGILIKRLKKSESPNCLLAVSDNETYDPFDIPQEEINSLAIVVGVIRLE